MPNRTVEIDGAHWSVLPSGFITQYDADEYGLLFVRTAGGARETRVTRYSPQASHSRERSLEQLSDAQLRSLFQQSQPSATSPEAGYAP